MHSRPRRLEASGFCPATSGAQKERPEFCCKRPQARERGPARPLLSVVPMKNRRHIPMPVAVVVSAVLLSAPTWAHGDDRGRSDTDPQPGTPREALHPEFILESLDVAEEDYDSTFAQDLVEDDLSLRARRALLGAAPARPLPGPHWTTWLPRLVVQATATRTSSRQDFRTVAFADFPLGGRDTPALPLAARPPAVPAPPLRLPPAEAACLADARSAAVALAAADPSRGSSMVERARRSAWLPELRLRVDRRQGRTESLNFQPSGGTTESPLGLDTAHDVRYEARATWDLAKLVFSTEELAAQAQSLRMADMRREIESSVNRLYFERRRLEAAAPTAPTGAPDSDRALRIQELTVELETLSGGALPSCAGLGQAPP